VRTQRRAVWLQPIRLNDGDVFFCACRPGGFRGTSTLKKEDVHGEFSFFPFVVITSNQWQRRVVNRYSLQ